MPSERKYDNRRGSSTLTAARENVGFVSSSLQTDGSVVDKTLYVKKKIQGSNLTPDRIFF